MHGRQVINANHQEQADGQDEEITTVKVFEHMKIILPAKISEKQA
jgi:hypothetical protein